jgi:hypothetical protein
VKIREGLSGCSEDGPKFHFSRAVAAKYEHHNNIRDSKICTSRFEIFHDNIAFDGKSLDQSEGEA